MSLIRSLRRLPLWALTCVGMLIFTFVLILARGLFGSSQSRPSAMSASALPTAEIIPRPAVSTPAPPLPSGAGVTEAAAVGAPAAAASVASAELQAPVSALQPPEDVREGHVERVVQARDQYRQWLTMSTAVVEMPDASFYVPSENQSHVQQVIWHAWFSLAAPVTVAILQAKGDAGVVSASIDGQPIGEIEHFANRPPDRQVSSVTLATGWHQLTVKQQGAAIAQIAVTDGRTAPMIVVPWAVAAEGVTDAKARDGAAMSAPAPASTAAALHPASAASAAPGVAAETAP